MSHPVKVSPKPWLAVPAILAALALPSAAHASTFPATELSYDAALLSQFNLINLGNLTAATSQTIAGRALVGGNVTTGGTETVCTAVVTALGCGNTTMAVTSGTSAGVKTATSTSSNSTSSPPNYGYGALTVFGSVTGSLTTTGGGDFNVQGDLGAGTINLNQKGGLNYGGASQTGTAASGPTEVRRTANGAGGTLTNTPVTFTSEKADTLAQVFNPFGTAASLTNNFVNPMTDLSRGIANLPGTPGVTAQALPLNQTTLFTSNTAYSSSGGTTNPKYGVVTTTVDNLTDGTFAGVANGTGNNSTFVIVTGQLGAGKALPTLATTNANVLYDFVDATELRFAGAWNASILAPLATITSMGGAINGSVVVASMTQSQSLNVGNVFNGDLSGLNTVSFRRVPEPASLAMLAVGVAGAAAARRRRRA